ncbi:MAG: hypothetical protein C0508_23425 [Cyanobacteria bacterium PR.023]|nr:hypothetical protein [Cyanobacteria bacterium PR.023]
MTGNISQQKNHAKRQENDEIKEDFCLLLGDIDSFSLTRHAISRALFGTLAKGAGALPALPPKDN